MSNQSENEDVDVLTTSPLLNHAKTLFSKKKYQESEAAFEKLIELGAEGLYGIGLIRIVQGDFDSAVRQLQHCLRLNPQHSNAYYYIGEILAHNKAREAATAFYRRALEHNPTHVSAKRRLGADNSI